MTHGFVLATDRMRRRTGWWARSTQSETLTACISDIGLLSIGPSPWQRGGGPHRLIDLRTASGGFFAGRPVVFRLTPSLGKAEICARLGRPASFLFV